MTQEAKEGKARKGAEWKLENGVEGQVGRCKKVKPGCPLLHWGRLDPSPWNLRKLGGLGGMTLRVLASAEAWKEAKQGLPRELPTWISYTGLQRSRMWAGDAPRWPFTHLNFTCAEASALSTDEKRASPWGPWVDSPQRNTQRLLMEESRHLCALWSAGAKELRATFWWSGAALQRVWESMVFGNSN